MRAGGSAGGGAVMAEGSAHVARPVGPAPSVLRGRLTEAPNQAPRPAFAPIFDPGRAGAPRFPLYRRTPTIPPTRRQPVDNSGVAGAPRFPVYRRTLTIPAARRRPVDNSGLAGAPRIPVYLRGLTIPAGRMPACGQPDSPRAERFRILRQAVGQAVGHAAGCPDGRFGALFSTSRDSAVCLEARESGVIDEPSPPRHHHRHLSTAPPRSARNCRWPALGWKSGAGGRP